MRWTFLGVAACIEYTPQAPVPPAWGVADAPPVEARTQTDRVLQVVPSEVDVLWVVDNSGSMQDDREALAANFPRFVAPFAESAADWHLGVITTSPADDGALRQVDGVKFLTPDSPDPVGTFQAMTTEMPTSFSGVESGRTMVYSALEEHRDTLNAGFLHDSPMAWLHVTVVTDEDDDSQGNVLSRPEFVDWITGLRSRVTFNSVVALEDAYPEERGSRYISLTEDIGGVVHDINGGDWGALLDDLGGTQVPPPSHEFFLSRVPVPDTIDVLVTDAGITWTFDVGEYVWNPRRNSVTFVEFLPPEGATVEITYVVAE